MSHRYLVRTCEVKRTSAGVMWRETSDHVEARSEADAMRAALTRGDNPMHLPRGSSVLLGGEVGPWREVPESLVVGVVGVEEYEPEEEAQ